MSQELSGRVFDTSKVVDHAEFYASHGIHLDDVIRDFEKNVANINWFCNTLMK